MRGSCHPARSTAHSVKGLFLALAFPVFFGACGSADVGEARPSGITFELARIDRSGGEGCGDQEGPCASVAIAYPVASGSNQAVVQEINDSIQLFLRGTLATLGGVEDDGFRPIAQLADDFVDYYTDFLSRNPNAVAGGRYIETGSEVALNNSKVVSVIIDLSVYDGGAHPNSLTKALNFLTSDGRPVVLEDLASDSVGFMALAEKEFKRARGLSSSADLGREGFFFDQGFALPANFAFTTEGLRLVYNPYEAASYSEGPTDFVIPYSKLRGVFRVDRVM